MQRIDTPTAVAALPALQPTSSPGYFGPGNVQQGQKPTTLSPDWCNSVQEEICSVIAAAGIALDKTQSNQLLKAIQKLVTGELTVGTATTTQAGTVELTTRADLVAGTDTGKAATADAIAQAAQQGSWWFGADTGPAGELEIALTPAPAAQLPVGAFVVVKVAQTNTGASTLGINGGPGAPITFGGGPLTAGQLAAGKLYIFTWDGGAWELVTPPADPNGVKIRVYGSITLPASGGTVTENSFVFITPFPNGLDLISFTPEGTVNSSGAGSPAWTTTARSQTGFTLRADSLTGTLPAGQQLHFDQPVTFTFEAIGH